MLDSFPDIFSQGEYISDKRYAELTETLGDRAFFGLNIGAIFNEDEIETILDNQSLLECMLFDELCVEKESAEIEKFLLELTKKYKTTKRALSEWVFQHPDRNDLPFFKNWTRGQLVEAYLSLVERDDCMDVLGDDSAMGFRCIRILDEKGFDTSETTKGQAKGLFNRWCPEPVKRKFLARVSDIKSKQNTATRIKPHQGALDVSQSPSDRVKAAALKDVMAEASKRPNRGRGRNNPTGGKVGFGQKAPRSLS